ncbi:MAG TPA: Uma2 family endonuclease [Bryobacteraceae bacterium]|nr:Uma2 family endonuclease [Bryobacteraceae bacterium]
MGVGALTSVEEYLKTVYRPDCDYVDGIVEERNLGELDHANVAGNLVFYFRSRFPETGIAAIAGWRFRLKPTRFRVPDVVLTRGKPTEQILTKPPLLSIEILSPKDTISR